MPKTSNPTPQQPSVAEPMTDDDGVPFVVELTEWGTFIITASPEIDPPVFMLGAALSFIIDNPREAKMSATIDRLRAENARLVEAQQREADEEAGRWQQRIEATIRRFGLEPIDPSGNESGDPLDWTDDQVNAALTELTERAAAAKDALVSNIRRPR